MEALFGLTLLIWNIQLVNVAEMHFAESKQALSDTVLCSELVVGAPGKDEKETARGAQRPDKHTQIHRCTH